MKITFLPENKIADVSKNMTILEAASKCGIDINASCTGNGTCGKCKVRIIQGDLTECKDTFGKLSDDEKKSGYRLACSHKVSDGMVVMIDETTSGAKRKAKKIDLPEGFKIEPETEKYVIQIEEASLQRQESTQVKVLEKLDHRARTILPDVLKKMVTVNEGEKNNFAGEKTVTIRNSEIIHCEDGDKKEKNYGVSVDIGTTTVVVMLWDMHKGISIGADAFTNPQGNYGADVISRITYINKEKGNLDVIRKCLIDAINRAVVNMCDIYNIDLSNVYEYVVVGNTTMSHIFAGVNPGQLAVAPFSPVFTESIQLSAVDTGLKGNNNLIVHLLPNIAGHVGSDISAGLITTDIAEKKGNHLYIDIGTNGEIVFSGNGKIYTCSTAAGPAFEGGTIRDGMRAAEGAIEKIKITDSDIKLQVIGDKEPVGICGSGIIDIMAQLVSHNIVDHTGKIKTKDKLIAEGISEEIANRVQGERKDRKFILYNNGDREVAMTQSDIRELQYAKSAIAAGSSVLMQEASVEENQLDKISIAGAFGSYIDIDSAKIIGLIPDVSDEKIYTIGNAAGAGATQALLSRTIRRNIDNMCKNIKHIELSMNQLFVEEYMKRMGF